MNGNDNVRLAQRADVAYVHPPLDRGLDPADSRPPGPATGLPLRALWRYRWSILGVTAVVAIGGLTALWCLLEPVYKAVAVVEFRSVTPYLLSPDTARPTASYEQRVMTQVAIMKQTPVLQRVVDRADVRSTDWYREKRSFLDGVLRHSLAPAERLVRDITVEPQRKTELIEVAAIAKNATDAAILANAVVDEYLKEVANRYKDDDNLRLKVLLDERANLEREIKTAEAYLTEKRRSLKAISPDPLVDQRGLRLAELDAKIEQLDFEIALARTQLEKLEGDAGSTSAPAGSPIEYVADPEWRALRAAVLEAERQLRKSSEHLSDENPTIKGRKIALEEAQRQLAEREKVLSRMPLSRDFASMSPLSSPLESEPSPALIRRKLEMAEAHREFLIERRRTSDEDFTKDLNIAFEIHSKTNEMESQRERLKSVRREIDRLVDNGRVPPPVYLLAAAVAPSAPDTDKRFKFAVAVLAASAAAGFGVALLRIRLTARVTEASELAPSACGSFLSYLPLAPREQSKDPLAWPPYAEAVRVLRTALLSRLGGGGASVVQVSSAGPGSGKSTFAAGLARSLGDCGKRVLLIDADFHRPSVSRRFRAPTEPGLANVLAVGTPDEASIRSTEWPGVSILTAGASHSARGMDDIANGRFRGALDRWRERFDMIVIDGPPMLASADAAILSTHVDGSLFVVRERHCRRRDLIESLAVLGAAGGRMLGTVFVGSSSFHSYGYYYGYGDGAGAGGEPTRSGRSGGRGSAAADEPSRVESR